MDYNVTKLKIRDIREDNDITQAEIAAFLKCDQSLYSKYEREEREIPLRYMIQLAEYYDISLDYLCGLCRSKRHLDGREYTE